MKSTNRRTFIKKCALGTGIATGALFSGCGMIHVWKKEDRLPVTKMRVGACGICCEVCGLYTTGVCPGCGSGKEVPPAVAEQIPCPIIKCAVAKNIGYCLKDCTEFPCDTLKEGYPYSEGYLQMHINRMKK